MGIILIADDELGTCRVHCPRPSRPLGNMLTGLQFLRKMAEPRNISSELQLVESGITSGQRMLSLIDALLDVPRLETGDVELRIGSVRVSELLVASAHQVSVWAQRNGVTVRTDPSAVDATVNADRWLTVRVLVNLLSNAIKFSPAQSVVIADARVDSHSMARFSVSDQGPGIPQEWKNKVFDKFSQMEARKDGAPVGSGLGLTFCRLAVEVQGGHIWIESEKGTGTVVHFTLPLASVEVESAKRSERKGQKEDGLAPTRAQPSESSSE